MLAFIHEKAALYKDIRIEIRQQNNSYCENSRKEVHLNGRKAFNMRKHFLDVKPNCLGSF